MSVWETQNLSPGAGSAGGALGSTEIEVTATLANRERGHGVVAMHSAGSNPKFHEVKRTRKQCGLLDHREEPVSVDSGHVNKYLDGLMIRIQPSVKCSFLHLL